MKFVLFPPLEPDRLKLLTEAAGHAIVVNAADEATALREIVDAHAFYGKLTPQLLAAAQQLAWVQSPTASLEHYLFPELIDHPCRLSNMRGLFSDVIADHVMSFVLCFARNIPQYARQLQEHRWKPVGADRHPSVRPIGPGIVSEVDRSHQHLPDCTMGIVGVGAIGAEVAARAHSFGMRILGIDPVCRQVPGVIDEVWPVDRLNDLLDESDYVVIAAPHTPQTEKLFRRDQFARMKATAVLINIGRGIIVDLADLTQALRDGEIGGAALDVFEVEPLPADHPLWDMPNVLITPHVAAASPRIAERHTETLVENIRRVATGDEPLNLVDKRRWF